MPGAAFARSSSMQLIISVLLKTISGSNVSTASVLKFVEFIGLLKTLAN